MQSDWTPCLTDGYEYMFSSLTSGYPVEVKVIWSVILSNLFLILNYVYSRTSVARTLMARLLRLFRTIS